MDNKQKKELTEEEKKAQLQTYADTVDEGTVAEIVGNEGKMMGFFENVKVLETYWSDACDVFSLLKDWVSGRYRETPWGVVAALVGALLYVLSPLDVIPDFIPLLGFTDDAGVFAVALAFAGESIQKYREWRASNENRPAADVPEEDPEDSWAQLEEEQ